MSGTHFVGDECQPPHQPGSDDTLAEFDEIERLQQENRNLQLTVALLDGVVAELEQRNDALAVDVVRITRLEARLAALGELSDQRAARIEQLAAVLDAARAAIAGPPPVPAARDDATESGGPDALREARARLDHLRQALARLDAGLRCPGCGRGLLQGRAPSGEPWRQADLRPAEPRLCAVCGAKRADGSPTS
jgi:hypothetical protein